MKRFLILIITALLTIPMCAQTEEEINTLMEKGIDAFDIGNYKEAKLYFEEYKEAYAKRSQNDKHYGEILFIIAKCCFELEDYSKAVEYGTKAMEIQKSTIGENNPFYALSLNNLAQSFYRFGDYSRALEYGIKAVKLFKITEGEKHINYATSLGNLALYYSSIGEYTKSLECGKRSLNIIKEIKGENNIEFALSLNNLAKTYYILGDYYMAVESGTKVKEIFKTSLGESNSFYATSLNNLSAYYSNLGDYAKAIDFIIQAMEIQKTENEENQGYALLLNNLSEYYFILGNYVKAMEYGTKAMETYKVTLGDCHPDYATSLITLSRSYWALGDFSKAMEYTSKAMEIRKIILGELHPDYASSLMELAILYAEFNDYSRAVELGTKAMEIYKTALGDCHPRYASSLDNLAEDYTDIGDYYKAVEFETEAMEIYKTTLGENHPLYATSLSDLAGCYSALGNYAKAAECCKEGVSIIYSNTLQQFANITTNLRAAYWKKYSYLFTDIYPVITVLSSDQKTVSELYNKSALFAKGLLLTTEMEMNKLILESGDEEALKMFEELRTQRLQLQKLYETPIAERHLNTDSLAQVADRLECKLVERSKVYGDFTRKLRTTWKDVQAALDKNEIAVEFLSFGVLGTDSTMLAALTLRKGDKAPKFIPLFEQSQIEELGRGDKNKHFIRPEVTDLVWGPLQEELGGIHRIYFAPSGILHSIGIEYLPGMEEYDIRRLSTTREVIDIKENGGKAASDNASATLYGGIDYEAAGKSRQDQKANEDEDTSDDISQEISIMLHKAFIYSLGLRGGSFNFLPGTLTEVENIKTTFEEKHRKADVLTLKDATEASVKALSGHAPGILHIATHGFYYTEKEKKMMDARRMLMQDDDRLGAAEKEDKALTRSGLLFAGANKTLKDEDSPMDEDDGILTAQEISKLDLRGLDLVVLSACETGKGDIAPGEGVFGLQRGFKKAGAGTIVMSLWKVDDNATQMMMTQLYKNLCNGMDKHEAQHSAQKHVREYKNEEGETIFNEPHYWAGFIILD